MYFEIIFRILKLEKILNMTNKAINDGLRLLYSSTVRTLTAFRVYPCYELIAH